MFDRLRYEPRRLAFAVGGFVALLVVALIVAVALHVSGGSNATPAADPKSGPTVPTTAGSPTAGRSAAPVEPSESPATDVARWNAMPAVTPATSSNYAAIPAADSANPDGYAKEFATELFTRDYRHATRSQLIAWAQYEDAPLHSPNYPQADWSKVLVNSLTDLTWDGATDTPIPAGGPWLALRSERARDTVSDVRVELDPQWEQQIAAGYQPSDSLATARDVSLTVTRHVITAGRPSVSRFEISLVLQLGTAARGDGYGVAATNNYVARQVS